MLGEPPADHRLAHTEPLGDLANRPAVSDERPSCSRVRPPRGAWRAAWDDVRPYLLTQYATVDGGRPTSRAIDSTERPASSWAASRSRSTTRTLVRVSDGLRQLRRWRILSRTTCRSVASGSVSWPSLRAAASRRSRLWRSSWRASSSSFAGVASSWPARITSSATRRASASSPAGSSPAGERRRPRRYSAARRVAGAENSSSRSAAREPRLALLGQRQAQGQERPLGLLAAVERRAGAVRPGALG